jgi:hypothetical protein
VVDAAGDELALRRAGSERAVTLVERPGVGWRRSCTTRLCSTPCSWEPSRVGRARLTAGRLLERWAASPCCSCGRGAAQVRPYAADRCLRRRARTKRLRRLARPD